MTELGSREVGGPSGVTRGEVTWGQDASLVCDTDGHLLPGTYGAVASSPTTATKVKGHHRLTLPPAFLCTGNPGPPPQPQRHPLHPRGALPLVLLCSSNDTMPGWQQLKQIGSFQSLR